MDRYSFYIFPPSFRFFKSITRTNRIVPTKNIQNPALNVLSKHHFTSSENVKILFGKRCQNEYILAIGANFKRPGTFCQNIVKIQIFVAPFAKIILKLSFLFGKKSKYENSSWIIRSTLFQGFQKYKNVEKFENVSWHLLPYDIRVCQIYR